MATLSQRRYINIRTQGAYIDSKNEVVSGTKTIKVVNGSENTNKAMVEAFMTAYRNVYGTATTLSANRALYYPQVTPAVIFDE